MAQSGSPNQSPVMAARASAALQTGPPSPSPQAQNLPQSKRDKRRTMLTDRLNDMITSFSAQHQHHYYAQLSAVQCDINLVVRADPYANGPLEDSPEAIAKQVNDAREEICRSRGRDIEPDAEESFKALGGKTYAAFVDEVNAAMEERDTDLAVLLNEYNDSLAELRKTNQYKMQLAQEEHALLSKTLRDRLVQSVTQKKSKLMRDKEQLDIADSSALLLNPNQFSLGNSASPGGVHGNRKTRHTRLRPGDGDEIGTGSTAAATAAAAAAIEGSKRKRKDVTDENENETPAPPGRNGENGILAAYRNGRAKITHAQFEAPLYSVERLFTEKDLALNMNKAHKAASAHFNRLKAAQQNGGSGVTGHISAGGGSGGDTVMAGTEEGAFDVGVSGEASVEIDNDGAIFNPSPSLLHHLPRSSSQSYHATRSQRNTGLEVLSAAATGSTPFAVSINATANKANPQAPPLPSLGESYIQEDLELMGLPPNNPDMKILQKKSLDKTSLFSLGLGLDGSAAADSSQLASAVRGLPPTSVPAQSAVGTASATAANVESVPMSKTTSTGGIHDVGGAPGAASSAPMTRSASTRT